MPPTPRDILVARVSMRWPFPSEVVDKVLTACGDDQMRAEEHLLAAVETGTSPLEAVRLGIRTTPHAGR
jgi:hypothetical protein